MTQSTETVSLLPCPFCGGDASDEGHIRFSTPLHDTWWPGDVPITEAFYVNCVKCGAVSRSGIVGGYQTKAEAIDRWNTRVSTNKDETIAKLESENARLSDVLDTERYKVAAGVQAIARAVQGRKWLAEPGRGSYTYDDERYQQEFGHALDEIYAALKPLQSIAQDWSDCPRDPLRVAANRSAALTSTKKEG